MYLEHYIWYLLIVLSINLIHKAFMEDSMSYYLCNVRVKFRNLSIEDIQPIATELNFKKLDNYNGVYHREFESQAEEFGLGG